MDILSPIHLIILFGIALLVFGPKRLPEIGSGIGKTVREFKRSLNGIMDESVVDGEVATTKHEH